MYYLTACQSPATMLALAAPTIAPSTRTHPLFLDERLAVSCMYISLRNLAAIARCDTLAKTLVRLSAEPRHGVTALGAVHRNAITPKITKWISDGFIQICTDMSIGHVFMLTACSCVATSGDCPNCTL